MTYPPPRSLMLAVVVSAGCKPSTTLLGSVARVEPAAAGAAGPSSCPAPPADALVIGTVSYYGSRTFWAQTDSWQGWWLRMYAVNYEAPTCGGTAFWSDYRHGVPGACMVLLDLTIPAAYPPEYVGIYQDYNYSVLSRFPGLGIAIDCPTEEGFAGGSYASSFQETWPGHVSWCISHMEPDRVAGAFLFVPGVGDPWGQDRTVYWTFDFRGDGDAPIEDDGTCLADLYEGATAEQVWDPEWWAKEYRP